MEKKVIDQLFKKSKEELLKRRENLKYFNRKFFQEFLEYERLKLLSIKDQHWVRKREEFLKTNIFTSDFYNKNSCCYCEFLSVIHEMEPQLEKLFM